MYRDYHSDFCTGEDHRTRQSYYLRFFNPDQWLTLTRLLSRELFSVIKNVPGTEPILIS